MKSYTLTINGKSYPVSADPAMPLLWVIRDVVGLKGTKFGYGMGPCGACRVHLNGQPKPTGYFKSGKAGGRPSVTVKELANLNHFFQESETGHPNE